MNERSSKQIVDPFRNLQFLDHIISRSSSGKQQTLPLAKPLGSGVRLMIQ